MPRAIRIPIHAPIDCADRIRTPVPRCLRLIAQLLTLISLFALAGLAWSTELVLDPKERYRELGSGHLSYLQDTSKALAVPAALDALDSGGFTPLAGNLGIGYSRAATWLAFSLRRPANAPAQWVLRVEPPTLDIVELYQIHGQSQIKQVSGDGLPAAQRALFQRSPTFALTLEEGTTQVLLRITTTSQVTAIPILLEADTFARVNMTETLLFGLYFGALLIVLIYNLVIGFSIRQRIYFLYCLLVLTHALFWLAFDGFLGLYLFPEQPIMANKTLAFLLGVALFVGNYFWAYTLGVVAKYRVSRILLMVVYLIALGSIFGVFYGPFPLLLPSMLLATVLSVAVLSYHALRNLRERDHVERRIFGAAYLVYGAAISITTLMNLSLLPANLWTAYSSQLSQFIHILALHLGLYLKVRASEQQRDEVRFSLARSQKEVEHERSVRRDQEELLHMIGHEVRTPIALIDSARQILELLDADQGMTHDPERQRRYASIKRAVSRLGNLLDIALSREQANPQDWQMTPRRIDTLIFTESVLSMLDPAILSRVSLCADPASPAVWADERMLRFALINLLDNAGKYSPVDTPITIRLDVHAHEGEPGVRWRIENQGHIIPADMQERIFDKYRRLDEAADTAGLGLGLYLVRYIFQRHGGWVRAENGRISGAEFTSWLPSNATRKKSP